MKKENRCEKYYSVLFNRKTGVPVKTFEENCGDAFLRMFALQGNVSATRDYIIFGDDGVLTFYAEGKKNDMPTICRDMEGKRVEDFGFTMEYFK